MAAEVVFFNIQSGMESKASYISFLRDDIFCDLFTEAAVRLIKISGEKGAAAEVSVVVDDVSVLPRDAVVAAAESAVVAVLDGVVVSSGMDCYLRWLRRCTRLRIPRTEHVAPVN